MKLPKIGLIGTGKFGKNHLKTWLRLEKEKKCIFVGAVEISRLQIKKIQNQFKCRVESKLEKILPDVDAVDIVTPASTHFELAKKCLNARKHILLEKPMALSFKECKQLHKLSKEKRKQLLVGHIFRYDPLTVHLKKLLDSGKFGKISVIEGVFLNPGITRKDVGAILNFPHHIDLCNYLLDSFPLEIQCNTYHLKNTKFEDDAFLIMKYQNNIQTKIHVGWLGRIKSRLLKIEGSSLSAILDYNNHSMEILKGKKPNYTKTVSKFGLEPHSEPLYKEMVDFIDSIKLKKSPIADSFSGLAVTYIFEKAIQSSRNNCTEKLNPSKIG